jgi:hypothetical protein
MRDTYDIGCSPHNVSCAQVGTDHYQDFGKKECKAFMEQLKRIYGEPPAGAYLKVSSNPHDFGTYHEVTIVYNDESEEHANYIYGNLENGCDEWDDEAIKELGPEYFAYIEKECTPKNQTK